MSQQRNKAPGPKGNLLLGNLREFNRDILGLFERIHKEYGDIIRLRLAHKPAHVLCHPAMAEQALITDTDSIVKYAQIKPQMGLALILGKGLIMSYGELWRRQRELINPLFRPRILESLTPIMIDCGQQLVARLAAHARQGTPVNIWEESRIVSLRTAMATLFGTAATDDSTEYGDAITIAMRYAFQSARNPLMPPLSWPTPRNRRFHAARKTIDDYVHSLIRKRKEAGIRKSDFLGLLLEATHGDTGEHMSAQQVRDEAVTMLGAGHETSASALTWTAIQIANRPHVARRIREELAAVVGDKPLAASHLRRLKYLQAVVEETLRLNAPVPVIPRGVRAPTTIGGYPIPAGSMVFISVYNIHRHPDFWRDPYEFNPDRFLGPEKHRARCSYMPFGAGERYCIGSNFAALELTIFLAQIFGAFELHMDHVDVANEVAVTLRPTEPVYMHVTKAPALQMAAPLPVYH